MAGYETYPVGTAWRCWASLQTSSSCFSFFSAAGLASKILLILIFIPISELYNAVSRWSHALLFHQSVVDLLRSALLIPLSISILGCSPISSCNILETAFLLMVTASTVGCPLNSFHFVYS